MAKRHHHVFIFFVFLFVGVGRAWGYGYEIKDQHEDARSLGMGRAATALTSDYASLYNNPAGLAGITEWNMKGFLRGGASYKIFDVARTIYQAFGKSGEADSGGGKDQSFQDALQILDGLKNTNVHGEFGLGGYWLWSDGPFFLDQMGGGLNIGFKQDLYINETSLLITSRTIGEAHLAFGQGYTLFMDESLRLGWSGRAGYRVSTEIPADLSAAFAGTGKSPLNVSASDLKERLFVDGDVGVQYDLPFLKYFRPRMGVAFLNLAEQYTILNPHLMGPESSEAVHVYRRHMNIGGSSGLPAFGPFEPNFAFDVKHLGIPLDSLWSRFHLGAELRFLLFSWWQGALRAGIDQGYITAGASGKLTWFTVDFVYYGREVGVFPGQNSDHRLWLQLGVDI